MGSLIYPAMILGAIIGMLFLLDLSAALGSAWDLIDRPVEIALTILLYAVVGAVVGVAILVVVWLVPVVLSGVIRLILRWTVDNSPPSA